MPPEGIDHDRIALGVQQPWAELILRGVKTIEVRSSGSRVRGPIYLYASRRPSALPDAAAASDRYRLDLDRLPRGVIVGEAEIVESRPATPEDAAAACVSIDLLSGKFAWRLARPRAFTEPVPVRFLPYGVWFYPFRRVGTRRVERPPS